MPECDEHVRKNAELMQENLRDAVSRRLSSAKGLAPLVGKGLTNVQESITGDKFAV